VSWSESACRWHPSEFSLKKKGARDEARRDEESVTSPI